jgi:hypothetical protein
MMRPLARPRFQSLAHGSELRGRVPQAPFVAWTPSGKRWLPFSSAFLLRAIGFLSGDRPGGATSFVRDRVARDCDALRSGPHLLQDRDMRLPARHTHVPRSHGRQERGLRPPARLLTASSRGKPPSYGRQAPATTWPQHLYGKLKTKKQLKSIREGRESFVADPGAIS